MVAITSFHADKCCHLVSAQLHTQRLPGAYAAASLQFLIYSTFVLVYIYHRMYGTDGKYVIGRAQIQLNLV